MLKTKRWVDIVTHVNKYRRYIHNRDSLNEIGQIECQSIFIDTNQLDMCKLKTYSVAMSLCDIHHRSHIVDEYIVMIEFEN